MKSSMGQEQIKVIGFDSWTGGSRFYNRLVEPLKKRGFQLQLIHLGSWGVDRNRPVEEMIDLLPVKDISYYGRKSFLEIIDIEKPSAVIFLSTKTFAHRAFNRLCKMRHIPTINQYHGLMQTLDFDEDAPYKINVIRQFFFVASRGLKMLTKVWPAYMSSLYKTRAAFADWVRFITDNFELAVGKQRKAAARDAKTDLCCVYTDAEVEHAVETYGFTRQEVVVVGNPDLVHFKLEKSSFAVGVKDRCAEKKDVMYIDTALVHRGSAFSTIDEFLKHLISTQKELDARGKHLTVKLHPEHSRSSFPAKLAEIGIDVCPNDQFVDRLVNCCAAIVEPSSAAVLPALMGLPVLLAKYGNLNAQLFGKLLHGYPRSREITDLKSITDILKKEMSTCRTGDVLQWIEMNSGPLPAENMPERVADAVVELIAKSQH